jgi:SAM-dependent methyltransferase
MLEVGCGTGQATLPFAKRGYSMLCLEMGENLALLAIEKCRQYPNVEIRVASFEDWDPQGESFDLLISAQVFHWIPPEIGYPKAAEALKDSGAIALFWNVYPDPDSEFFEALQGVYRKHAPQLAESFAQREPYEVRIRSKQDEINATGLFEEVIVRHYPCSVRYNTDQYIKLLNTFSDHRMLDDDARRSLFEGVAKLIDRFGGAVERPHIAVLYFARKKRISVSNGIHSESDKKVSE